MSVETIDPSTSSSAHNSGGVARISRHEPFAINFIRQRTIPLSTRRLLATAALGSLILNALLLFGILGVATQIRLESRQRQPQLHPQAASPSTVNASPQEMAALHQQAKQELSQLNAIIARQRQRFPIAAKLAALTKTLPARTWITTIAGKREDRTMTIQATYLIDPDKPYELPTKSWIEALTSDPFFGQGLKRLELQNSSRKTQGKVELFVFQLLAEWQPLT